MLIQTFLFVLTISVGSGQRDFDCPQTHNNLEAHSYLRYPISRENRCGTACTLNRTGIIEQGKINGARAIQLYRSLIQSSRTSGKTGEQVIVKCSADANGSSSQDCETAASWFTCLLGAAVTILPSLIPDININLPPLTLVFASLSLL